MELENEESVHKVREHYTSMPKGAKLSLRGNDYQCDKKRTTVLPTRWLNLLPAIETDTRPLRWLLYLLEMQRQALEDAQARTTKYIDNSLLTQQGNSSYAQNDRATLFNMRERLYEAQSKLEQARATLLRTVQQKLVPSSTLPYPYPRSSAWTQLRIYAQNLTNPSEYLPSFLHNLLHGTVEIADTPYLYQRWCGIKLLHAFEQLEWFWYDDPVGALFLGGEIVLHKQGIKLSIWVEPRFSQRSVHPSGFSCNEVNETHPDYMIVTSGPSGNDAFILDPTTTGDEEIRRSKGKYLDTIESIGMATVAGNPVVRHPLRAWSAAPIHRPYCEIDDVEGRTGTIPMHPLDWSDKPLLAWVNDIDAYSLAWGKFAKLVE